MKAFKKNISKWGTYDKRTDRNNYPKEYAKDISLLREKTGEYSRGGRCSVGHYFGTSTLV